MLYHSLVVGGNTGDMLWTLATRKHHVAMDEDGLAYVSGARSLDFALSVLVALVRSKDMWKISSLRSPGTWLYCITRRQEGCVRLRFTSIRRLTLVYEQGMNNHVTQGLAMSDQKILFFPIC